MSKGGSSVEKIGGRVWGVGKRFSLFYLLIQKTTPDRGLGVARCKEQFFYLMLSQRNFMDRGTATAPHWFNNASRRVLVKGVKR